MTRKNDGSVLLSPQHGLNPSVLYCPVCGKDGGLALLGRLPNDAEAPRKIPDKNPCEACKAQFEEDGKVAFLFFIVSDAYDKQTKGTPWQFFYGLVGLKKDSPFVLGLEEATRKHGGVFLSLTAAKQFGLVQANGELTTNETLRPNERGNT